MIRVTLREIMALILSAAVAFGNLPLALAQTFPGEPEPPPASNQHLSTEQGVQAAIEWAKFGKQPTTSYAVDTAIGVISVAYPPAGVALAAAWGIIQALGSGSSDPVGDALRALSTRLDQLDQRVNALQAQIAQIQDGQLRLTNEVRMRELLNRRDEVKRLTFLLRQMPTDQKAKEQIVYDAQVLAARFLPDAGPDAALWYWSDQKITINQNGQPQAGEMLPADFKVLPTFDYYVGTLILLMNAIEYEVGSNTQLAVKKYGPALLRHAAFLSVRPPWREFGDTPGTLPEQVMARNTCYIQPSGKYPTNRTCGSFYICDDLMRRTRTTYPGPNFNVQDNNQLCTLPARQPRPLSDQQYQELWKNFQKNPSYGTSARQSFDQLTNRYRPTPIENDMERAYAVEAMAQLADKLVKLAKFGTTRDQYIGQFDMTFYTQQYLYGVKPNGELLWFGHLIGVDKNPPKTPSLAGRAATSSVAAAGGVSGVTAGQPSQGSPGVASKLSPAAKSAIGNFGGAAKQGTPSPGNTAVQKLGASAIAKINLPPAPKVIHKLGGPKLVGNGWQNFVQIIPAGQSGFYALSTDGSLKWYRHDGFADGSAKWKGPVNVNPGSPVAQRRAALPSSAISAAASKAGSPSAAKSGAAGALAKSPISAAAKLGAATRFEQKAGGSAVGSPAPAQVVGPGVNWLGFKKIIAGGDGVLYGINPNGALYWYRHQDYTDPLPQPKWSGPSLVGSGWQNFVQVFSTGEGVIYAVQPNGDLLWYRHRGYLTGQNQWEGPKKVGNGWAGFKRVFSPGAGMIYAIQADGALLWYQHDGYQDGTVRWQGPTQIAADWGSFVQVFPHMWGTPQAPVIR